MEGPPIGPGGGDITWPDQVAPQGRKASSTRKIKPQTSNLMKERAQLSVGFKHLAASRGSASGRTASSRYQEKQRDKEKDTSFSGGPLSGSSAPKADISELLSQCHSIFGELRVSE